MLSTELQTQLLTVAKASLRYGLEHGLALALDYHAYAPELQQPLASFVTLEIAAQLRGCIGSLEARRPLVVDVAENAFAAGFRDRRFPPLKATELAQLSVHISLLSTPEALLFKDEADLLQQLRPQVDGLILQVGAQRGTFLPAVWDSLPEPMQFLQQLKLKTGLARTYWSPELRAFRYTCQVIAD